MSTLRRLIKNLFARRADGPGRLADRVGIYGPAAPTGPQIWLTNEDLQIPLEAQA